jgi:hypothetical protein
MVEILDYLAQQAAQLAELRKQAEANAAFRASELEHIQRLNLAVAGEPEMQGCLLFVDGVIAVISRLRAELESAQTIAAETIEEAELSGMIQERVRSARNGAVAGSC